MSTKIIDSTEAASNNLTTERDDNKELTATNGTTRSHPSIRDFEELKSYTVQERALIEAAQAALDVLIRQKKKMSKHKHPVFDQNIFTAYPQEVRNNERLIVRMRFSSVVLYELTASTTTAADLNIFESWRKQHIASETMLTPSEEDWWETGKLIRRLRFGDKSASHGLTPKLQHAHQLQNDALIARTATLAECYVVTTDVDDFQKFVPFMPNLEIVSAADFFQ